MKFIPFLSALQNTGKNANKIKFKNNNKNYKNVLFSQFFKSKNYIWLVKNHIL